MADVIILGDLTLTSAPYGVSAKNGHDFLEPVPELTMRARAVRSGNVLVKKRYPNVIRTIKVNISSSDGTKDSLNGNLRAIQTELRKLDIGESLVLQYTPNGGSVDNFSDIISGSRETRLDWFYVERDEIIEATITLECEPFWRGSQITIAQQTFSPTPAVLTASTVQGDIETPVFVEIQGSSNSFGNDLYVGSRKTPITESLFDPIKDFQGNTSGSSGVTHNGEFSTVAITSAFTSLTGLNDDLNAVSFSTAVATVGWAVGDQGLIVKTIDGGVTWSTQDSGTNNRLRDVHAASTARAWAVGNNDTILITTDGGTTWVNSSAGTNAAFGGITFANADVAWIAGGLVGGTIVRTTNASTAPANINWTIQMNDVGTKQLNDISSATTASVYACGQSGLILKTSGGGSAGSTFFDDNSPVTSLLSRVNAPAADVAFAVGTTGGVIQTAAGSTAWSKQTSGETVDLNDIKMNSSSVGWFCGDNGVLRKTTDGGTTWTAQASGTPSNLKGIYIVDANTVYMVGGGFIVIKTTDGGTIWLQPVAGWSLSSVESWRGRYRVFFRCRVGITPTNTTVRASAGFAGGTVQTNEAVTMANTTTFQMLDLGEINVPITRVSNQISPTPIIKLEAKGSTAGSKNFDSDVGALLPLDGESVFVDSDASASQPITLDSDVNAVNKGNTRVTWNGSPVMLRPGLKNNIVILETSTGTRGGINDAIIIMKYFDRYLSPESSG
jgi:photosystem II stability/assembly factor-like uncharacterized protein